MIYEITETNNVAFLFDKWDETLIWSCLQKIMGKIYANHLTCPTSAMAIIGDFMRLSGLDTTTQQHPDCQPQNLLHWGTNVEVNTGL